VNAVGLGQHQTGSAMGWPHGAAPGERRPGCRRALTRGGERCERVMGSKDDCLSISQKLLPKLEYRPKRKLERRMDLQYCFWEHIDLSSRFPRKRGQTAVNGEFKIQPKGV
jgi:hypothetical protein